MARTIRNDQIDFYRYMPDPGRHAYGPYDTMAWPRRHQKEHGGKGKIQKLMPVHEMDQINASLSIPTGRLLLEWVDVE